MMEANDLRALIGVLLVVLYWQLGRTWCKPAWLCYTWYLLLVAVGARIGVEIWRRPSLELLGLVTIANVVAILLAVIARWKRAARTR
jgi:hypothetical protein